jgi:hypothetical protein
MQRFTKLLAVFVLVFGVGAVGYADEAKGTIKNVDTKRNEVVLKGVVKDTVYELNKDASVWLDGARCKLADLVADDHAVLEYEKKGEHLMVSVVRGLRNAKEATGTVADVVGEKKEIVIKGTVKNTTYELSKGGTVFVGGKSGSLKDIQAGDQVLITYEQRGDHNMMQNVTVLKRK